ncbi:MAG TPA: NAD-dependent epimerase/dehydratase family protein [Pirellulaceae bacterium]
MEWVWVTGAKGFIAGHFIEHAVQEGAAVAGIGHGHLTPRRAKALGLSIWVNGDVSGSNLETLRKRAGPPSSIIHLAGGSSVSQSITHPAEDFHRTVVGTLELLDWLRLSGTTPRVVFASSAAVYGAGHDFAIPETAALEPCSPYGHHKAIAEQLFRSYAENYQIPVVLVRLFSVYGEGLEKQLIHELCEQLASDVPEIELAGTGNELRDWLHVSDAVRLLWLARAWHLHDPVALVNGGTGISTTVRDLAIRLSHGWPSSASVRFTGQRRPGDPLRLVANPTRLSSLGFHPEVGLDDGLARVVNWYLRRASEC